MQLKVLLFASYADALGGPEILVDLPGAPTVEDVVRAVRSRAPAEAVPPRPLVAVNHAYAGYERRLVPTDEVALIPPVAGG